jgi:MFS family permease
VATKSGQGCTEKRVDMKRMSAAALLWSSCLAMLTIGVNSTAIMAALPTMRTELLLGSAGLQWAVNAYLVVAAACIVPGGHAAGTASAGAALSASAVAARIGLRYAMAAGMVLLAIASAIVAVAVEQGWIVILLVGLALIGAGLALPYALAPRLALSALAPAQTGQGSGIVNACTFLSGSAGVACGAIAFAAGGFVAVLTMIALIAIAGAALSYAIAETG